MNIKAPELVAFLMLVLSQASWGREFTFEYVLRFNPEVEPGKEIRLFLPLAGSSALQEIVEEEILSSVSGEVRQEKQYGNRYWYAKFPASGEPIEVKIKTQVRRLGEAPLTSDVKATDDELAYFLQANTLVPVDHPVLDPILQEIDATVPGGAPADYARAIYDWVVDNVEYKKVGTGWGNGDTFWACNERYGNCTDFHALLISLARSRNIPARFEIGFPIPESREAGVIGGYHCWVEVYLPEVGWMPLDASEAAKNPQRRELYFGGHTTDRVYFSTGRDLILGPEQRTSALNYFIYPHIEVEGEVYSGPRDTHFSYQALPAGAKPPRI